MLLHQRVDLSSELKRLSLSRRALPFSKTFFAGGLLSDLFSYHLSLLLSLITSPCSLHFCRPFPCTSKPPFACEGCIPVFKLIVSSCLFCSTFLTFSRRLTSFPHFSFSSPLYLLFSFSGQLSFPPLLFALHVTFILFVSCGPNG